MGAAHVNPLAGFPAGCYGTLMSDSSDAALERLRSDLTLRREGVSVVVDALLRQRVRDLVDPSVFVDVVSRAAEAALLERLLKEHVEPAVERVIAGLEGTTVGALLPEGEAEAIEELVTGAQPPTLDWLAGAVDPDLFRRLFAPVWQDVLVRFVRKLPGLGGGLAGALSSFGDSSIGRFGRAASGKVEEKMQSTTRDFAKGLTHEVRLAMTERLKSEEGQELDAEIRRQVHRRILETDAAVLLRDLDRLPRLELLRRMPAIVSANAKGELGRSLVRAEVEAFLAVEGDRTGHEVLEEAGVAPQVRAYLRVQAESLLGALLQDEAFEAWITRWLEG